MLIINILDILRKYSDADHRLSQQNILARLKSEYGMEVNRKSIKPNIMTLIDFGYDIEYTVAERSNGADIYKDFYLNREFDDEELRTLIDSLLFSINQYKRGYFRGFPGNRISTLHSSSGKKYSETRSGKGQKEVRK